MKLIPKEHNCTGLLPDPVDRRDIPMAAVLAPLKVSVPEAIDYTMFLPPVRDQGSEGTCVAFGTVAMKEYQERMEWMKNIFLSERHLYTECKKIDGIPGTSGTYIRSAMKVLQEIGITTAECWPYRGSLVCEDWLQIAAKNKIRSYAALNDFDTMCQSLHLNGPFPIGFEVTGEWYGVGADGRIEMPRKNARVMGGHCVCAVGYDRRTRELKIRNSWGQHWANKGYALVSEKHVTARLISAWAATDMITSEQWLSRVRDV